MICATVVRRFEHSDVPQLLPLMRALAEFEGYDKAFGIGEADLLTLGLGRSPRFQAWVADREGQLLGMAVSYLIPFSYDAAPVCVLKELYVHPEARALGLGRALFAAVREFARLQGSHRLRWEVLADNRSAQTFYRAQGAAHIDAWQLWQIDPRAEA